MRPLSDTPLLLARVLGLSAASVPALAERLEALGGLSGLQTVGAEGLGAGTLSRVERRRLERLLALVEAFAEAGPLPDRVSDAGEVAAYFRARLAGLAVESFWVLMLDARARPIGLECVARGTLTACLVHPREVFAPVLRRRAAQIVVVHNHPSGDPEPSAEDVELTERLVEAGELLGVPVVDHVVVARGGHRSIAPSRGRARGARAGDADHLRRHRPPT